MKKKESKCTIRAYHIIGRITDPRASHHGLFRSHHGHETWRIGTERSIMEGPLEICDRGYHSSPTLRAVFYHGRSYGDWLTVVLISKPEGFQIEEGYTGKKHRKNVSRSRKLIAAINWRDVLGCGRGSDSCGNSDCDVREIDGGEELSRRALNKLRKALAAAEANKGRLPKNYLKR